MTDRPTAVNGASDEYRTTIRRYASPLEPRHEHLHLKNDVRFQFTVAKTLVSVDPSG